MAILTNKQALVVGGGLLLGYYFFKNKLSANIKGNPLLALFSPDGFLSESDELVKTDTIAAAGLGISHDELKAVEANNSLASFSPAGVFIGDANTLEDSQIEQLQNVGKFQPSFNKGEGPLAGVDLKQLDSGFSISNYIGNAFGF